jgi:hypothetical protein
MRNCGSYVQALVEQLEVEHNDMDDIVLAPPMKREETFI